MVARHAGSSRHAGSVPAIVIAGGTARLHAGPDPVVVIPGHAHSSWNAGSVPAIMVPSSAPRTCEVERVGRIRAAVLCPGRCTGRGIGRGDRKIRARQSVLCRCVGKRIGRGDRKILARRSVQSRCRNVGRGIGRGDLKIRARQVGSEANLGRYQPIPGTVANPTFHDRQIRHCTVRAAGTAVGRGRVVHNASGVHAEAACCGRSVDWGHSGVRGFGGTASTTERRKCNCQRGAGRPSNAFL